jgi:3-phosphoshikimate 1-carboxyvinyltransferase
MGIVRALKRMGADIRIFLSQSETSKFEPMGDIIVSGTPLKGLYIRKTEIPCLIDELPILLVAACFAKGRSVFEGITELRVKETDRIKSMSENLRKMKADIAVFKSDNSEEIVIEGGGQLKGARVRSFGDHRTAMSMIIAGLLSDGETSIDDISCINKSFPDFLTILRSLNTR